METIRTRKVIERPFFNGGMLKLPRALPGEIIDMVMAREMLKHGVDLAVIYAYERTLLWITTDNIKSFSAQELAAWDAAQAEFWKTEGRIS